MAISAASPSENSKLRGVTSPSLKVASSVRMSAVMAAAFIRKLLMPWPPAFAENYHKVFVEEARRA